MLLLMMMSLVWMFGGDAMFGSASQRRPRFTVNCELTRQLSPTHTAYVGRGTSIVQSASFCAKLIWKSRATGLSGARFHFDGSRAASCGSTADMLAGALLKVKKPWR